MMWNMLTWRKLGDPAIAREIGALRSETLRLLLLLTAGAYLLWHSASLVAHSGDERALNVVLALWGLFVLVAAGFALAWRWQSRGPELGAICCLVVAFVAITTAVWMFSAPAAALAYALLALVAVVLLRPMAGVLVTLASLVVLALLRMLGPLGFVGVDYLIGSSVAALVATVAASALGYRMVLAVEWSLTASDMAQRNLEDAQLQRAEVLRTLKQLDHLNYSLERANAALDVAWKAAEAAERSKSEFVVNISHELRTPLNLVVGFSEMMMTSQESYGVPLPAPYRTDLHAVYRAAKHLLQLTNDVIDLARVGAGRLTLVRAPVDLQSVVDEACDIVREYVEAKGLTVRSEVQPDVPPLSMDPLRIRQVLLNLLTNAARFTHQGGITVSAVRNEAAVVVRVTDTGSGIPPDDLERIFEDFHHGKPRTAEGEIDLGGAGLGLPISRRLVELHGGEMGVDSVVGSGTTFWFTLPLQPVAGTAHDPWRPALAPTTGAAGERILVLVGGSEQFVGWLRRHLGGYKVVTAPTLARARSAAIRLRASAILRVARPTPHPAEERTSSPVPVIDLPLAGPDPEVASAGVAAHLVKPVTRANLRKAIERLNRPVNRILLVDDDAGFTQLLSRQLRGVGGEYEIAIAHNGREALEVIPSFKPDLVILDLVMPELGGREVLRSMARGPATTDVAVIVLSGQDDLEMTTPLRGPISVTKSEGFTLEETLRSVEAVLEVLTPPTAYLNTEGRKETAGVPRLRDGVRGRQRAPAG